jgi:queuine/archaeosine tRNA-ribosyltransferase
MKGQKQSRTDLIEKKLDAQNRIVEHLLNELSNMRDLAIGTLETLKLMPGYEKAIEQIRESIKQESSETEKIKSLEEISD